MHPAAVTAGGAAAWLAGEGSELPARTAAEAATSTRGGGESAPALSAARDDSNGPLAGQRRICLSAASEPVVSPPALAGGPTPNEVRTTRFTPLTWLPKSLFYQFQRVANIYFLFISVLVCIPSVTTKSWKSKVIPFVGVLTWTALKDLYEDSNRRRDDRLENDRPCKRYSWLERAFRVAQWRSCVVGDLVLVSKDEPFPVDLVVLCTSDPQGMCFTSTVSLDGETNLKERRAPAVTQAATSSMPAGGGAEEAARLLSKTGLEVLMEAPHPNLGEANGSLTVVGGEQAGVGLDSFLPRGCVLRNTAWALGVAVYVGPETKLRLNAAEAPTKVSDMQRLLSLSVAGLLFGLFSVCLTFAIAGQVAGDEVAAERGPVISFLRYVVTLYHVVPISLYVMFEVLKLLLANHINTDALMVDPETQRFAEARTSDLVEEMGQVGFVFSDKTGTLTANEMRFAFAFAGGARLGPFISGAEPQNGTLPPAEASEMLLSGTAGLGVALQELFTLLAVCHDVRVDDDGNYQAASPDEVALCEGARSMGLKFADREATHGVIKLTVQGPGPTQSREHIVAQVLEFDSDRKRMSVVCAESDGSATIYTKGADAALEPLVIGGLQRDAVDALADFSLRGLRTLVCASRKMPAAEYASWKDEWGAAGRALEGRAALVAAASAKIERGLRFLGVTAVEDRLQDEVPETIAALRGGAGIRVWVLTGDKVETAVEIAKSVRLFDPGMILLRVAGKATSQEVWEELRAAEEAKSQATGKGAQCGLILDGTSVRYILESDGARRRLYELGLAARTCVCCRLSPAQKKQLVELVRQQDPKVVTLSIGDGANDVPMIQGAHIGIGIRGKEGMGAVQASDVAISQFRFLRNLLLCHGRRSYHHVALFLCYYLYKNMAVAWGDILHAVDISFAGDIAYPEWLSTLFNAVFTSWPVVILLAFDRDMPDEEALRRPTLYRFGPERQGFNARVFVGWMALAAIHGALAWVVPMYGQRGEHRAEASERENREEDFWVASATAFTVVIEIVTLKLALVAAWPISRPGAAALLLAGAVYVLVLFAVVPFLQDELPIDVVVLLFTRPGPLLCILLLPALALLPDMAIRLWAVFVTRRSDSDSSSSDSNQSTPPSPGSGEEDSSCLPQRQHA